jgi:hypothetical protein
MFCVLKNNEKSIGILDIDVILFKLFDYNLK